MTALPPGLAGPYRALPGALPTALSAALPTALSAVLPTALSAALPAAVFAVAAYVAATQPGAAARRLRTVAPGATPPRRPPPVVPVGAALVAYLAGPRLALAALVTAYAVRAALRRHAATTGARAVADALPDLCRATAAELRAGAPPAVALARAADDAPPDLAAHLRRLAHGPAPPADAWATLPGAERLRAVGALWYAAADAGSGLADGLDRLAESLSAEHRQRADLAAQLAGPKASAAVLAALPLAGIALAAVLGARPYAFLTGTTAGAACLVAGALLDVAGVLWVRRITARAAP
jgi:tight adherence protein B